MGNCHSRLCCTNGDIDDAYPKTSGSEKSAQLEENPRCSNSAQSSSHSASDRVDSMRTLCQNQRRRWEEVQIITAKAEEERIARGLKCPAKNYMDDPSHPINSAKKGIKELTEATTSLLEGMSTMDADEQSRRREEISQLRLSVWKDVQEGIRQTREIALARREKGVNEGASTSGESPLSDEVDEWLILNHPSVFEPDDVEVDLDEDDNHSSQSSATRYTFNEPETGETDSLPRIPSRHRYNTGRPRVRTPVIRWRNDSVEGTMSSSGSEGVEEALPQGQTATPSPTNRSRRSRFLRNVFDRITHRARRNRVNDIASSGSPQSSNLSASRGNSTHGSPSRDSGTSQGCTRSPPRRSVTPFMNITRTWHDFIGRFSPRPSPGGKVTQILVRPYDENQTKKGCTLLPSLTAEQAEQVLTPASVEEATASASQSPAQSSTSSSVASFEFEEEIDLCSLASNPNIDARPAEFGGT
ncbi:hypothetical protein OS493_006260 [Desmophyllum pertusum]|uniref:Uncharacterized protein n=1 Tax=Desmophyllum pertusum TaxID=174260 RepID=A0A9X0A4G2_9CNID|nr:hypothetical protein OS493_006260 [Desmophyllum pertusum]